MGGNKKNKTESTEITAFANGMACLGYTGLMLRISKTSDDADVRKSLWILGVICGIIFTSVMKLYFRRFTYTQRNFF